MENNQQTDATFEDALNDSEQQSLRKVTHAVYFLQALSYLFGITIIIAVIVNYVKWDDVRGTWLDSHFRWQTNTFWFGLLWCVIGIFTFFIVIGYFILIFDTFWVLYRIIKGWLRLNDSKPMYVS